MTNEIPGLVSVVIPTFNAAAYVTETIDSVLAQDYPAVEIIVVDDESTDATLAAVVRFGEAVRIIATPHRGLAATRNRGIAEARGEFLLHLDADDLLPLRSISRRIWALQGSCDMVTGRLQCFISPELGDDMRRRFVLPDQPQQGHLPGASIIRAAAFRRFGKLDESFAVNADLEWWVRARDLGAQVLTIDDIVILRRIHGRNLSTQRRDEFAASQLRIIRGSLERRRRSGVEPGIV